MASMFFRSLRAIVDRNESRAAFQLLKESLQKDATIFPAHPVGWQGGSRRYTAYWLPELNIWSVLEPSPPSIKRGPGRRFWNCFGIGDPAQHQMLAITVEINPPHEGEDRRVAGMFARDEENRIYVGHTGKVGGGRGGIGQSAFRRFLGDNQWHEIRTQGGNRAAVALGPIDAADFANQIAEFVHKVADFKESVVRSSAGSSRNQV